MELNSLNPEGVAVDAAWVAWAWAWACPWADLLGLHVVSWQQKWKPSYS